MDITISLKIITPEGEDFLYALGFSYLSPLEQMVIKKLRTDGEIIARFGIIAPIMVEYLKKSLRKHRYLIKEAILRECDNHDVPESTLENVLEGISQILIESSIDFVQTYSDE